VSDAQHKTSGIQLFLLCLLLILFYRPAPAPTGFDDPAAPPRGLYHCSAGGFGHLPAGTLTLAPDGHYESYRPRGGGSYSFTPGTSSIEFLDGDYHYWEYRGVFQRAPQPHALGTSAHPDDLRERIVLMPLGATDPIGAERPGEYQYCYLDTGGTGDHGSGNKE
jgi:hypothetical protein